MGCPETLLSVAAQVAVAQVVGQDEDHVGPLGVVGRRRLCRCLFCGGGAGEEQAAQKQSFVHGACVLRFGTLKITIIGGKGQNPGKNFIFVFQWRRYLRERSSCLLRRGISPRRWRPWTMVPTPSTWAARGSGARQAAGNATEQIARAVEYAHRYGVRIHATLNTLLWDDELEGGRTSGPGADCRGGRCPDRAGHGPAAHEPSRRAARLDADATVRPRGRGSFRRRALPG